MKPKSRQRRLVHWLGPAYPGSADDYAKTFVPPRGYELIEVVSGRQAPNGSRKVTLVCQLIENGRTRVVCKRCGAILRDTEPYDPKPDYHHPKGSTCEYANQCYPPPESYRAFYPKKARRARKRGAKLAAKMTRRARRG
jgi:hypothetical protein